MLGHWPIFLVPTPFFVFSLSCPYLGDGNWSSPGVGSSFNFYLLIYLFIYLSIHFLFIYLFSTCTIFNWFTRLSAILACGGGTHTNYYLLCRYVFHLSMSGISCAYMYICYFEF